MIRFTILGCGSSGGVPRIGGDWGDCDPNNPKNERTRCSLLVERIEGDDKTTVLIDSGPDLRTQLLRENIGVLDGVVYTHEHADHMHGLDELRVVAFNRGNRLPVWADQRTANSLTDRFAYAFFQPDGSDYRPILDLDLIPDRRFAVNGPAGPINFDPLRVKHGRLDVLGFRVGDVAYIPDVDEIYAPVWPQLDGLKLWIVDALRYKPHPSHAHLARTLEWIAKANPVKAVITNMHVDLDYETLLAETPDNVVPAFDGMKIEFPS